MRADNLSYKEVKQCIQSFVYGVNTPSRWGCCTADTEVLSTEGWKKYNELREGDLIYTWNNGKLELNPVRKVVIKPFKGQMHAYTARGYNQTVTPTHRMLVKKHNVDEYIIAHSEDVFDAKAPYCLPVTFKSVALDDIGLSDAEIRIAAALYTDGNFDMRGDKIHKVQLFKSPNRIGSAMIEADADELGLQYTKTESIGDFGPVYVYTFYGDSARALFTLTEGKKRIANTFCQMSQRQSELFIHTWALFDGDETKMRLQYDNDEIASQLQHIALRAGKCSYLYDNSKAHYVKIRQVDNIYPTDRTPIDYDDIVWCPNVENGTAVFRKDGCVFISGQTQAPFTNITLDWKCPADLAELNCIVGGKEMPYRYKDCQKEMDMINKAYLEVMIEGDANGRGFNFRAYMQ